VNEEIFETPSSTPDFQTELAAQLAELVPEAIADGKIDMLKLQALLAQDAAEPSERFGLFWPGKQRALRVAQMQTTATLKPSLEQSKDWNSTGNVFIEGDNLEVLRILQKHYHSKIKLIYIDPPYNTGKDFIYPDNFREGLDTYLEWTKQVSSEGKALSSNSESDGRYHSNWLNMMYPRLKLARNLLAEDGAIFVSISEHEVTHLRKLLDEIMGESNFLAQFVVRTSGGRQDSANYAQAHEYLIAYARKLDTFVAGREPKEASGYNRIDERTGRNYKTQLLRKWGDNSRRQDRPNLFYPITAPDGSDFYPRLDDGSDGRWRWSTDTMNNAIQDGLLEWKLQPGGWVPYEKILEPLDGEENSKPYSSVVDIKGSGSTETKHLLGKKYFDYPKATELMMHIFRLANVKDGDTVLDFFAGSATTAHALLKFNNVEGGTRNFIQVQLPEPLPEDSEAYEDGFRAISDISIRRIHLAAQELESASHDQLSMERPQDLGFRVYKLAETSFAKWRPGGSLEMTALEQHLFDLRESASDSATEADLLTEILIKQGYSLTESVKQVTVGGMNLLSVGEGLLLAYLDETVKPELAALTDIAAQEPSRFIILEDAFHGDDELKTNLAQLCKSKNIELWTA
jgi:adenine-specific DNA-methyltransferase